MAFNLLREWAVSNLNDYSTRRIIGCAPQGHHPQGEEHQKNEETGSHEYVAQMFLFDHEGTGNTFLGAEVVDAPNGLFLIGDVVMDELQDDGTIDIGSSMQKSAAVMIECLRNIGGYELDLKSRRHYEEHVFINKRFGGEGELAGFKLWLPIRQVG